MSEVTPDHARAQIGTGRPRPALTPRTFGCDNCGASLEYKDERAVMISCSSCGSTHQVDGDNAVLVQSGQGGTRIRFELDLGHVVNLPEGRYEVAARVRYRADDDDDDDPRTYMYYLYSPRRKGLWFSVYNGEFDLSWKTFTLPAANPFHEDGFSTLDGRSWKTSERGQAIVEYVDGALPFMLKTGDRWDYVECEGKGGQTYEVNRALGASELDFTEGRTLSRFEAFKAVGDEEQARVARNIEAILKPAPLWAIGLSTAVCVAALLVSIGLMLVAIDSGQVTFDTTISHTGPEAISKPFELEAGLTRVEVRAPQLSNAWVYTQLALVNSNDNVIHVDEAAGEYYFGYEGGESWSEGNSDPSLYWHVPEAGSYRLLVSSVGGYGNDPTGSADLPSTLRIMVFTGAWSWWWPMYSAIISGIATLIFGLLFWGHPRRT